MSTLFNVATRTGRARASTLALAGAVLVSMCNIAIADHESGAHGNALLAEKSSIQFISVKNAAIGEVHHFKTLMGGIDGGKVEISIPLVDVETMIPIRNERMQKMLFETDLFPKAVLSSELEMAPVMAMASGENLSMTVALDLDLHGVTQTLQAPVRVSRLGDEIHVTTEAPIILNVANFNLADGVERLKTVAALNNISTAVPVTAHLVFSR